MSEKVKVAFHFHFFIHLQAAAGSPLSLVAAMRQRRATRFTRRSRNDDLVEFNLD